MVLCTLLLSRILGTLDLPLREAVSNGKQTVNAALKGKKGDTLDVRLIPILSLTDPLFVIIFRLTFFFFLVHVFFCMKFVLHFCIGASFSVKHSRFTNVHVRS